MNEPARTTVVVPVRALEGAKSRLGSVLDAEERAALVLRLLDRTLTAATAARSVGEVVVVSPDPTVLRRAQRRGVRGIAQRSSGLNAALEEAARATRATGRLLVLPGDLPGVSPQAIDALAAAADGAGRPVVVLAPDRHGRGTNALLLDPPGAIRFAFGTDSRAAHRARTEAAGVAFVEVAGPLSLDIDTPDDLLLAESETPEALGVA
ncbi:MAG TPA: 2-phospho-L-lactate guanylyltransferase [Candidatus Limnocylindrales bacterium]|nr:2-phospho-L-lactate guanylyltransferase [Candidatus Limnocylindrales bacterium]